MLVVSASNDFKVYLFGLQSKSVVNIKQVSMPECCAASEHYFAVCSFDTGVHVFSRDGSLVTAIVEAENASSVAFHPFLPILAAGKHDGTVWLWDLHMQKEVSRFPAHQQALFGMSFTSDGRLLLSSRDKTASIITFDESHQRSSQIMLKGHTNFVTDILQLPNSNQCVTCSHDMTLRVWDSRSGEFQHTLSQHSERVFCLALHSNRKLFASGSYDESVIVWSADTFELLLRIGFPQEIDQIAFGLDDTLYAGVYMHGVMPCNVITGKVGHIEVEAYANIFGLTRSMSLVHSLLFRRCYS